MEKKLTQTLVILYQSLSKTNNGYQALGLSVYNGYSDGSLNSVNYSLREPLLDFSKLSDLIFLGNEYGLNLRFRKVEDDVELFLSDDDLNNLREGVASFNLDTSRDTIASDPDAILRCLPDTALVKTYVGGVKDIISKWCIGNCDTKLLNSYKAVDEMMAKQYAEKHGIEYIPLSSIDGSEENNNSEEIEKQKELERQQELEKYSSYPKELELMLNCTVVSGMESLNKVNEFNGEETIHNLRDWLSRCKLCSVKSFGNDMKYVENNEIKISDCKVSLLFDGVEIKHNDLDKLRELSKKNTELSEKLKELELAETKRLEEERKRIEEERKRLEEEEERKRLEEEERKRIEEERKSELKAEESTVEVEESPVEVESLPMDIGVDAEDIEKEISYREEQLKNSLANYPIISQSYGNPETWVEDYAKYRKTLSELNEESDYILIMCKSNYSSNPIIVGLLKRIQVEVPDVDEDNKNSGDTNYEYKFEIYDEFELLSTGIQTLSNLGINYNLEMMVIPSRFTLNYITSPLLEICAKPEGIPENISVIFLDEKRNELVKERVAEILGYAGIFDKKTFKFELKDLEESEYESICRFTESLCLATALEERLNLRVFHFSNEVIYKLDNNSQADMIIADYTKEQTEEYFDFNTANKRSDGKLSPIAQNYVLPQMMNDDVYFSIVKSYSETKYLSDTDESDLVKSKVPNLKNIFVGISADYPYFNSSNYQENFKVERDYYKLKGKSKEEIDEIIASHNVSVIGTIPMSKEPIQSWEKPFLNYLKNLIKCELICEHNVKTELELNELIKNGVLAEKVNAVLRDWCKCAFALNYMHTNFVADEEVILSLDYDKEGVTPSKYCEYNVIKVGSDRNVSLKTDWGEKAREVNKGKKIDGFLALSRYVELHIDTYCWAEVLIRLLRWGSRKQKFLQLEEDLVFDFSQAQVVEEYTEANVKSMTDRDLVLNQILAGRYKINSLDAKNLGPKYDKYMRGTVMGSRQQNFKSSYASLMVSLGRNDADNWEQIYIDTLSFVKSLYKNQGKVEIKGVDGEWSLNTCKGITYDSSLNRIVLDLNDCGVVDEQTNTVSPKVQVRNEQTIGVDIKEYERINKSALDTYIGATDNVILSDLQVDGSYILHKMQIRTLDRECYEDANKVLETNPNVEIDKIILPFEVFTNFCFADNFIARTDRAIKDMAEKWAMPYVIADHMYNLCVGNYIDNRYEMPIASPNRPSNLEIYWNCVLYGYQVCFNGLSMNEKDFCSKVVLKDGELIWSKSSDMEETVIFKDDPVSMKLKSMIESKIKSGGQISPVVHFEADLSGTNNEFSNQQLLCLKGQNNFYFVFVEGEYSNVVLLEKNGKVPVLSIKDAKQLDFFRKLSNANKIGYSSPELKSVIEALL